MNRNTWKPLTERDAEVLGNLDCAEAHKQIWVTPMQVGGRDASHHSATLAKLLRRGLVLRKRRAGRTRPSYLYRISPAGTKAFRDWQATLGGRVSVLPSVSKQGNQDGR